MFPSKKDISLFLMFVFFSVSLAYGQAIFESMDVLTEYGSQRSKALGYSTVALDGYPGAAQINPATIGHDNVIQINTYFMNSLHSLLSRAYDRNNALYQPYVDVKYRQWALAAYATYLDLGNLVFSNPNGEILGRGHSFQYSVSLAGAYQFPSLFAIGLGLRYITDVPGMSSLKSGYRLNNAHAFASDFGIFYQKIYDFGSFLLKSSAGWSLVNFGTPLRYNEQETNPLPMTMQGGLGFRFITKNNARHHPAFEAGFYVSLSHVLARKNENGHTFGPFESLLKGWSPYCQDYTEKYISFGDQFYSHFGLELTFFGALNLRGGYINRPSVLGYSNEKSVGIGLDLFYATLDFTYVYDEKSNTYKSNENNIFQLAFRIPLRSNK